MKALRIVFMGTPEFAVGILDTIYQNHYDIAAVITAPVSYTHLTLPTKA